MTSSWGIFRQVNSYLVLSGGVWWCFFMLLDETREPSWETEGTFYSIVGVGHLYVLTTSLACCSIFVSIGLKERHDIWGPSSSLFSPPLKLRWRWPWQLVGRSISGFTLSPQLSSPSRPGNSWCRHQRVQILSQKGFRSSSLRLLTLHAQPFLSLCFSAR